MEETYRSLQALEELDRKIATAAKKVEEFEPRLDEIRAPLAVLERERETTASELTKMRENVERMERNAARNRERLTGYETRLTRARAGDDEAMIRAELDLISRAVDADVHEAAELSRQVTRAELRLEELDRQIDALREEIRPLEDEVLAARAEAEGELGVLRQQRQNHAVRLDEPILRLYERVRAGKTRSVLAPLTADGACGACFNIVPMQRQSEIRRGDSIQRCEACGVILLPREAAEAGE